jgi:Spy/CpxP family protein refolding chaperone
MSRPQARVLAILLAFVLGMLCGGWVARKRTWRRWDPQARHTHLMQQFSSRLDLSAEQQAQIGRILETSHQRLRSLHEQVRPQFEALRGETSQQIRALLTPDQAVKYDTLEAEFATRRHKRRGRWRGPSAWPTASTEEHR